jgi:hypothetical protein
MLSVLKFARDVTISRKHDSVLYVIASWMAKQDLKIRIVLFVNGNDNADA